MPSSTLTGPRSDHPEIQEKIRRCVKQGHIDPEDFKGVWTPAQYHRVLILADLQRHQDPEKNKPGEKGIRLTAKQREKLDKEAAAAAAEVCQSVHST